MAELIICEKPKAAQKIAEALADGKAVKKSDKKVPYYLVTHGNKDIIVASAVGHLFTIAEKEKGKWTYPVFDIEWKQSSKVSKYSAFTSKYVDVLKKLSKDADEITVATDYDVEGEVIGLNIVRYICKRKDASRMKFSTLTKPDIIKAYETKKKTLDWGQANAGETRHFLDWYNGINYSRALTSSMKKAGMFKIMSTGRVQGPALKIIVDREKEIKAFKPVPFWQIELLGMVNRGEISAWHIDDKFWEKEKAEKVMAKVEKIKSAKVSEVNKTQFNQSPPVPFDLTTLQTEAYRCFGINPKETLSIAQELYISGCISYPRTSSQQLPKEIGFKNILSALSKNPKYEKLASELMKKELNPRNGKKTDPAHPAIYPTGVAAKVSERPAKLYDLIVKRFMAVFGEDAIRETVEVKIDANSELFIAKGTRTVHKGWHVYYEPYVSSKEEELPPITKGDSVDVKEIKMHDRETQPPKRYTQASIVRELEKRNLGTKATRSEIVDTLFQRGYIDGKAIEASELGIKTIEALEEYSPKIVDEELTRKFEEEMEDVREGKKKEEEVLSEAKAVLTTILNEFKEKEEKIGAKLCVGHIDTMTKASTVGNCPMCAEGKLVIKRGKFGKFVACDQYPACKTTFKLPSNGMVKTGEKTCEHCNHPMITIIRRAKKPQEICINPECPSKKIDESKIKEKTCPKCGKGKLVLRKSVYGAFMACNQYPKCRNIEKIVNNSMNNK